MLPTCHRVPTTASAFCVLRAAITCLHPSLFPPSCKLALHLIRAHLHRRYGGCELHGRKEVRPQSSAARRAILMISVPLLAHQYSSPLPACAASHHLIRNAARARGKDAASKAQRSHFGKKRFEVLRTGLSRSGGVARTNKPQNAGKERPEISLAHARWPQHGPEHGFEASELDYGLRSPFSPVARARSPSVPSSASNRSKILRALDADSRL